MRGNRVTSPLAETMAGSIPACAGEPTSCGLLRTKSGVYPRVCGGTQNPIPVATENWGLSPRVRGNLALSFTLTASMGSIPACAGEPHAPFVYENFPGVYPRVCGGTIHMLNTYNINMGLSPRVRGNQRNVCLFDSQKGSIPACAGEPPAGTSFYPAIGVYPRVCGGTEPGMNAVEFQPGLSPRVRGNLLQIKY